MLASLPAPVLAVCGYSGSGKTTLLTRVIPHLVRDGLEVAVIKHDAHSIQVDRPGKDSDRLFQAGAAVLLRAPNETFSRWQHSHQRDLLWALTLLSAQADLILVEGHKDTPLPKVWLEHPQQPGIPEDLQAVRQVLPWGKERVAVFQQQVAQLLREASPPLWAGILLGGQSRRMGKPKQLLPLAGQSLVARLAQTLQSRAKGLVYLGSGPLPADAPPAPHLPDPPGPGGPLAGMVAALRWQPWARWLFVPVDAVALGHELLSWWLEQFSPGCWGALLGNPQGEVNPVFAAVAPQLRAFCESSWLAGKGPRVLQQHPKSRLLKVPENLREQVATVNTPEEWQEIQNTLYPRSP